MSSPDVAVRVERNAYWPEPLDLATLLATKASPPGMIIDDWLPCGYMTLIAGHGGAGKSNIALHLAASIATGRDYFGLATERRRVLYLSFEDRADVLHWRLSRICEYSDIDAGQLAAGLTVMDLVGRDALLWRRDPATGTTITPASEALRERIAASRAELLVVDGVSDTYSGSENDRAEVKQYVNAMVGLMPAHGGVVLLHHVNRQTASASTTTEGYSGSTGWHNSARARWYLYPEMERTDEGPTATGDLLLELQKSNLGRADQAMRFRWDDDAHLFVGRRESGASEFERRERETSEQDGIVEAIREVVDGGDYVPAATTGNRTALHVLKATDALPETLRSKDASKRFWRHVERLRRMGRIRTGSIRRANRHTTETLQLSDEDPARAASNASNVVAQPAHDAARGATAPNASHGAGGTRGAAHAHCQKCDGEGCQWCAR